jgi:hypothetical protein
MANVIWFTHRSAVVARGRPFACTYRQAAHDTAIVPRPSTCGGCPWLRRSSSFWFIDRRVPGVGDHVERVLSSLDKSADVIARARSAEGTRSMQDATDAARHLGIFGAPTFAVGTEIFWGDDRLEEAIAFASGC